MLSACDINAVLESSGDGLGWDEFVRVAKFSGVLGHCYDFLKLSEHLLGAHVEDTQYEQLAKGAAHRSGDHKWASVATRFLRRKPDDMMRYAHNLLFRRDVRLSKRLRRIRRKCFPPVNAVAIYYGISPTSFAKYFYYARRLLRPSILIKGFCLSFRLAQAVLRSLI